jgi:hypothetical protein
VSVYTVKPAEVSFDVMLRKSTGQLIRAGSVEMETFYPAFYGGGDAATPSGRIIAAATPT